ncbi:hypothetical protein HGRIS_006214 [Hohenbuehelia grisea]|uniref:Amidohydrolase-related domain-containing protein n=1 Tax=Hohenbuehelia grisea TaxID=104357 RepID=A0ABR3K041_9AGAR
MAHKDLLGFSGTFVHCPQLGQLNIFIDHLTVADEQGFIKYFGEAPSDQAVDEFMHDRFPNESIHVEVYHIPIGSFMVPTFCDLHLHAPQFLYQGVGLHLPLMEWLHKYAYDAEKAIDSNPALATKVYSRLAERLLENGTGAVLLFGTIKEESNLILAEVMQKAGIRAFVGKLSMDISSWPDYVEPSADAALSSARSFIHKCRALTSQYPAQGRLVEPVITPRFVPTCTDGLLAALGSLAIDEGVRIQSHMAEALDQVEWVRKERGREDLDVFYSANLLTSRTVQAHCTYLDMQDLSRTAESGTAVAHCPLSNAYFSAKPFPLREALDCGVKVGLGTDIAGGYSLDVMNAMRQAVVVSKMREGERQTSSKNSAAADKVELGQNAASIPANLSIDWKESMYLATRGGALALGLPKCGLFEVGAHFDAQESKVNPII